MFFVEELAVGGGWRFRAGARRWRNILRDNWDGHFPHSWNVVVGVATYSWKLFQEWWRTPENYFRSGKSHLFGEQQWGWVPVSCGREQVARQLGLPFPTLLKRRFRSGELSEHRCHWFEHRCHRFLTRDSTDFQPPVLLILDTQWHRFLTFNSVDFWHSMVIGFDPTND